MAKQTEIAPGTVATNEDPKGEVKIETRPATTDTRKKFEVEHNNAKAVVYAADAREAWALHCDGIKSWPSPKTGKVVEVKE